MNDDIPPLLPPDQMPPIRSQHDLYLHWRALMGPLGFSERLLWISFVGRDGAMLPHLTQIADLPTYPGIAVVDNLMEVCQRELWESVERGSVAMLLSRPGQAPLTDSDRAWARALVTAADRADLPLHPVHLANDEALRVFAPDGLVRMS